MVQVDLDHRISRGREDHLPAQIRGMVGRAGRQSLCAGKRLRRGERGRHAPAGPRGGRAWSWRPSAAAATATPTSAGCGRSSSPWPCGALSGSSWSPAASLTWTSSSTCCGTSRWTAGISWAMSSPSWMPFCRKNFSPQAEYILASESAWAGKCPPEPLSAGL